jgi:6-phosphogluconolactonase
MQRVKVRANTFVYFGTYTMRKSKGIYACRFDADTGRVDSVGLAAEAVNPTFLAVHPTQPFVYAVNEIAEYEGRASGGVSAFRVERASGRLVSLNTVASRGSDPCYLALDKTGKTLLLANYGGGSVAALRVLKDGRLGEASAFVEHTGSSVDPERQRGPHAHAINLSPDNRFAFATDLGLDQILVYRFDPGNGSLALDRTASAAVNPGAGPRHLVFHPNGKFVYLINEMESTVSVFTYRAARGVLRPIETVSTLRKKFAGDSTAAEVQVHPKGKFLYASNRGEDSIAVFAIDGKSGTLIPVQQVPTRGKTPRNFAIDPTGSYLLAANQNSDNVVVFRIDPTSGRLTPTGQVLEVPSPACVKFRAIG